MAIARIHLDDRTLERISRGLTERDRLICRLLDQHRVLTAPQLQDVAFTSPQRARLRLVALYRLRILDRFRPYRMTGSAPYHYLLDELGAAIVAAERGTDPAPFRRDHALRWSRSQRLDHLVGVNGFFTALCRTARHSEGRATLHEWWSERRCVAAMGGAVHPDGYGVWEEDGRQVEFCLEYDRGSEPSSRLADKLPGYELLQSASGVRRWVLLWLPSRRREAEVRRRLPRACVPVATAVADAGDNPASPLWLPVGSDGPRVRLADLPTSTSRALPRNGQEAN